MRPFIPLSTIILTTALVLVAAVAGAIALDLIFTKLDSPLPLRWWESLGYAGAAVLILLLVIVAGALLLRRTRPKATLVVDDSGQISIHRSKRRGDPEVEELVHLEQVAMVTWYIDLFDPSGTEFIQFWDRDPQLRMDILGLTPTMPGIVPLAEISRALITASPTAETRLRHELNRRISSGTLESNIDIATWEPVGEKLPPMAPGVSFEGRNVVRRPTTNEEHTEQ